MARAAARCAGVTSAPADAPVSLASLAEPAAKPVKTVEQMIDEMHLKDSHINYVAFTLAL